MTDQEMEGDGSPNAQQLPPLPQTIEAALMPSDESRIITEPTEPFRIVHVNDVWCRTCGFDAEEVLGQTCKIMQGPGTCKATLAMLRQALLLRRHFAVQLLNYSKQGRPFMNTLQVGPLVDQAGQVTHFIGVVLARFLDGGGVVPPSVQQHGMTEPPLSSAHEDPLGRFRPVGGGGGHSVHSAEDEGEGGDDSRSSGRVPPFLTKLTEILTAEGSGVVTLSPEAASFSITDPARFAKEVLPRYFKHNKLGSFSQQLHTYGFRRRSNSASIDAAIEFYHDRYTGDPADFLNWIRSGGAVSKRTTHRPQQQHQHQQHQADGLPPPQLLSEMLQVQEGMKHVAYHFQQVKAAHAMQIRTILTKLTLRGIVTPESAAYISTLPPHTPLNSPPQQHHGMSGLGGWSDEAINGLASAGVRFPSEESMGLQAQLDALEAGLPPLPTQAFPMSETNDFHGEEALNMYVDTAPSTAPLSAAKDSRQPPYPVDGHRALSSAGGSDSQPGEGGLTPPG